MTVTILRILAFIAVASMLAACSKSPAQTRATAPSTGDPTTLDTTFATTAQVLDAVRAAANVTVVPDKVAGGLDKADQIPLLPSFDCKDVSDGGTGASLFGKCAVGDRNGTKTMAIYGDSRAEMWEVPLEILAAKNGWRVRTFALAGCPAVDLQFQDAKTKSPYTKCDSFHNVAVQAIRDLHPDLIVTTAASQLLADGSPPTPAQWEDGWNSTLSDLTQIGAKVALVGDLPFWRNNDSRCLAAHLNDVQACSAMPGDATPRYLDVEQAAAQTNNVLYVAPMAWVCGDRCEPIIADTRVYNDQYHFTPSYAKYLTGALGEALQPVLQ